MFGPALLINPVATEGATQRTLYLPAGARWVDFWTGKRERWRKHHCGSFARQDSDLRQVRLNCCFRPGTGIGFGQDRSIELRIYAGANGDFAPYEDEGDNYDYEHGAYSVIPLHWEEKTETVTIGDRRGSFPGMLDHRTLRVVIVREGHGTGIGSTSDPDATIEYDGKATSAQVRAGS